MLRADATCLSHSTLRRVLREPREHTTIAFRWLAYVQALL